jgi:hypothetical protein
MLGDCPVLLQNEFMGPLSCAGTIYLGIRESIIPFCVYKILFPISKSRLKFRTERMKH